MKMPLNIILSILFITTSAISSNLKICLNDEISSPDPINFSKDIVAKEVLFKNVYETLFYYSSSTNKIKVNIATKIESLKKNKYLLKLNEGVFFHNNKIFTVKKSVDYKDVIFSLKRARNPHFSDYKITSKGLSFTSDLDLKSIYMELSRPNNIIFSRAYWRYLKKKKKEYLFLKRPIGTGPFEIKDFKLPYQLKKFKNYHLTNRLQSIRYILSSDYIKDSCDIFWDHNTLKKKSYIQKHGYKSNSSGYDSILFLHNSRSNRKIVKLIDPLVLSSELLYTLDHKLASLPIPPNIKEHYVLNKKETKLKEKDKLTISIDKSVYKLFNRKNLHRVLKKYFLKQKIFLTISKEKQSIHLTTASNLETKELLNKNLYCPYKSKACNNSTNTKELQSILLKEHKIIPLAFYKRTLFYKKNISNIGFDFIDGIDYSEILYIRP